MQRVGRYRLLERIGVGAFATVWAARDDELDVPVAVKVLADNWTQRADIRGRFLSEARILRRIENERIVRVFDIGELDDGRPYFVMDYADKGSLEQRMDEGPIPVDEAVAYGIQAAEALAVLHDHGVVHRDVTPGNLLLRTDRDGNVRLVLADLGMAKALAESSGLTQAMGTPSYMAPEQASGHGFDARADVYAIGAVTYALLTGKPPFAVTSMLDVSSRAPNLRPISLSAAGLDAPRAVDLVLSRALAHDPEQRFESAVELARAFRTAMKGIRPDPPPKQRRHTVRAVLSWAGLVLGVLLLFAGAFYVAYRLVG
jgi:serine/threonine protein kinase